MNIENAICLSIGSNLGNRLDNLRKAISDIKNFFNIQHMSHILETKAILPQKAPKNWDLPFYNMLILGDTNLNPIDLLSKIKTLEKNLGRNMNASKWSPRIIDIDILFYKNMHIENLLINIPHTAIVHRDFLQYLLQEVGYNNICSDAFTKINNYSAINHLVIEPKFVGILNITPDSFSDGGLFFSPKDAECQARNLYNDGATLIEFGAQSTRPGYIEVPPSEEIARLGEILERCNDIDCICVDTYFDEVVEYVIKKHNVKWINDQNSQLKFKTIKTIAENDGKLVIMLHGTDLLWLKNRIKELKNQGMQEKNIIIDPGIGFRKSRTENISFIKNINYLKEMGHEIFIGHSRKSFISHFSNELTTNRDIETIAISEFLAKSGVDYIRVHDVKKHMRFFVTKHCIEST